MEMTVMYIIGSLVGLILTGVSFILGIRTLQNLERERWQNEMHQRLYAIQQLK